MLQRYFRVFFTERMVKIVGFWQHSVVVGHRLRTESPEVPKYSGNRRKSHEHPNRNML